MALQFGLQSTMDMILENIGNPDAWEWYGVLEKIIRKDCMFHLRNFNISFDDKEDVIQDIHLLFFKGELVRFCRNRETYKSAASRNAYLRKIAVNMACKKYNIQKRVVHLPDEIMDLRQNGGRSKKEKERVELPASEGLTPEEEKIRKSEEKLAASYMPATVADPYHGIEDEEFIVRILSEIAVMNTGIDRKMVYLIGLIDTSQKSHKKNVDRSWVLDTLKGKTLFETYELMCDELADCFSYVFDRTDVFCTFEALLDTPQENGGRLGDTVFNLNKKQISDSNSRILKHIVQRCQDDVYYEANPRRQYKNK